jgi:hypothetical protein
MDHRIKRFMAASVNVAFCGQSFCRRSQLNFVRATRDYAVAWLDTGAHANETRISRGYVDEAPSEPLTGNLHEHVRPARFHQHCLLRHDGDSLRSARVQDSRTVWPTSSWPFRFSTPI